MTEQPEVTLRDLLQLIENQPAELLKVFPSLSLEKQLRLLLFSSGALRMALILSSSEAKQLVHQLSDQEAFITVKEIGYPDAVPLFSLMNAEQIQYVSDLDTWSRDEFKPLSFVKLFKVIGQCGEAKLSEWLRAIDPEILVLFLQEYGWVTKLDIFEDQTEEMDISPHITQDNYYRFHFHEEQSRPLLEQLLRILKEHSPEKYGQVLESAYQDMPSAIQEEASRFRSARLSEKGFPDFEQAVEIYWPLSDEQYQETEKRPFDQGDPVSIRPTLFPVRWLPPESFLRKALKTLAGQPQADHIRMELAMLGNKVMVADGMEASSPETMQYALKKVAGYITIGLQHLTGDDIGQGADQMLRSWLHFIFRVGYTRIFDLTQRSRQLEDRIRFRWIDNFYYLPDTPLEETLRGLTRPRPLLFEGVGDDNFLGFRDFHSLEDVHLAEERLAAAEAIATLFVSNNLPPERIKEICLKAGLGDRLDTVKWSQVIHTMWAQKSLNNLNEFRPLSQEDLHRFIRTNFIDCGEQGAGRRIVPEYNDTLFQWLGPQLSGEEMKTKRIVEDLILAGSDRLEEDLAGLDQDQPPDPRLVQGLCVSSTP